MKGAMIISKDPEVFQKIVKDIKARVYGKTYSDEWVDSFRIDSGDGWMFMLYDRKPEDSDEYFEKHEIPWIIKKKGYRFGFFVECRSEVWFCKVLGSVSPDLDIFIVDNSEHIYRPNELSPEKMSL